MSALGKCFLLFFGAITILGFSAPTRAFAATNIYYSVGSSNTTDYKTGTPTITIDGSGNATFSVAQTSSSTGIGDVITYGGSKAYITGKTSTTVWTVQTATGSLPSATTSAPVTSIMHAFTNLKGAVGGGSGTATSSSYLNTSDLVAGNYILNIPCYNDTGAPETTDGNMSIGGFTLDSTHYIRIYTPTSTTAEVNASQRHNGTFDTTKGYAIQVAVNAAILTLNVGYVRIDGIQINNSNSRGDLTYGVNLSSYDTYISNNIFYGGSNPLVLNRAGGTSSQFHWWNNLFIGNGGNEAVDINTATFATSTIYNNTFYNVTIGLGGGTCTGWNVAIYNNLFASTTKPISLGTCGSSFSGDYNSTATSSMGYPGTHTHDLLSQTFSFFDAPNGNYALTSSDTGAKDQGTSSPALDSYAPFANDIQSNVRPSGTAWDIGAFEYTPAPDTTPPGLSGGSPTGQIAKDTTSTTLSVTTNENATCKYSTTAGTAYGSMTNTFTTTGGTSHSTTVSGLQNGHLYTYYIRCQDTSNNADTSDYSVSFEVNQGTNGIVYASTCSVSDTNAAMAYVNDGDTLFIPAGTCTGYTSSTGLGISKAITVEGAGIDQTILQIASTTGTYSSPVFPMTAAATVKNLTITTESSGNCGTAFNPQVSGFRITNIKYQCNSSTPNGYFVYPNSTGTTGIYGLIDHATVIGGAGTNELVFVRGATDSWQVPSGFGSSNAVFIEDSTFSGLGYVTDCNANSRCVVRNTSVTGDLKIDGHGPETNSPSRGMRNYEIYNNTWTSTDLAWTAIEMRSGSGLIFNNTAPNQTPSGNQARFYLHDYAYYDGSTYAPYNNKYQCPSNYPIMDQIGRGEDLNGTSSQASEPFYVWNNTLGGSAWELNINAISTNDSNYCSTTYGDTGYTLNTVIAYNRDYYISSSTASFDGTATGASAGVGSGLYANIPATCTTGVAYWATDKGGNWDAENSSANDGALYKCTATNTWTLSYTPYAHPHYLTATSTSGTDQVDIGAGARFFGNGKFYELSTSTASGSMATIGATTTQITASVASSSADYWLDLTIQTWSNSGTHHKAWTETSTTLGATTTHHMIGDLTANTQYALKIDNAAAISNITSTQCSAGTCTSDSSGKIYFDYTGGYSTHTFDLVQGSAATPPTVLTPTASSIGQNSATASSTITDVGGSNATSTGFAYGTTASYGATTTSTGSFAANTPTSATLSSLLCGTTYHFAAYATNANGIAYSSDATFTTSSCASPTVTTSAASSLAQTSATLNGSITATGGADATQSGFAYGTTSDLSAVIATSTLGAQTGAASFSSSVSSLTCNTTYYARAYATNGTGTGYGSIVSFTTSACSVAAAASAPAASETTVHPSSAHRREEVLVSAPAVSISSAGAPTLESFIKALISIGVIPADKAVMALSAVSASAPAVSVPHQNLSEGNVGESVRTLQKLLNEKGYTVSSSGAGSPGHETSIFGPATAKALKAFQKANGIPATGFFGPLTRAALGQ